MMITQLLFLAQSVTTVQEVLLSLVLLVLTLISSHLLNVLNAL